MEGDSEQNNKENYQNRLDPEPIAIDFFMHAKTLSPWHGTYVDVVALVAVPSRWRFYFNYIKKLVRWSSANKHELTFSNAGYRAFIVCNLNIKFVCTVRTQIGNVVGICLWHGSWGARYHMIEVELVAFQAAVVTDDGFGSIFFSRWFPKQVPVVAPNIVVILWTTTAQGSNVVFLFHLLLESFHIEVHTFSGQYRDFCLWDRSPCFIYGSAVTSVSDGSSGFSWSAWLTTVSASILKQPESMHRLARHLADFPSSQTTTKAKEVTWLRSPQPTKHYR